MIDQLIKLVQQNAGEAVINNTSIPNDKNQLVIKDIAENISSGLKDQAGKGNISDIMSLFKTGSAASLASHPIVTSIISKAAASLSSKFGISPQIAQQVTASLLPKVLNQFVNKTNDPNDKDFDLQDMLKNFGGGSAGDLLGKLAGNSGGLGGLGKMFGN
jgi:hypothetical protein